MRDAPVCWCDELQALAFAGRIGDGDGSISNFRRAWVGRCEEQSAGEEQGGEGTEERVGGGGPLAEEESEGRGRE